MAKDKDFQANVRLIASAPELLEACKVLVDQWHRQAKTTGVPVPNKGIALATQAIRKAEGKD